MSFSNNSLAFPTSTCTIAGLEYGEDIIIYHQGNQEVCNGQGCLFSTYNVAKILYGTVLGIRRFFWLKFNLWGINGQGEIPPIEIGWDQNNAQWICTSASVHSCFFRFNDRYAVQPKIVAHEYMHGIISRIRPLNYQNQSGALNESLADVFGIIFNYWYQKDTGWKIANRDLSRTVHTSSSLLPYSNSPAPQNDYGHVHTNSCIPSHAFYIVAQLIGERRDETAAQIWFLAFLKVDPNESFKLFAQKTISQAYRQCGINVALAVKYAWIQVGVLQYYIRRPPSSRGHLNTSQLAEG